jgi:hypothetical protein
LTFSTFFTLWVVPLAYTLFDDLARVLLARVRWALRQFGRSTVHRAEPGTSHGASIG